MADNTIAIPTRRKLSNLLDLLRAKGVRTFRVNGLEIELGIQPVLKPADEPKGYEREPTEQELLLWSAGEE